MVYTVYHFSINLQFIDTIQNTYQEIRYIRSNHFFLGLGNLVPKAFYIFTIFNPVGTDFPAYQELTSDLGIWINLANCY